ncbi:MAG: laccase domain protein [Bacteroidia bacterium]|nr:MAG: laccase domain protein [Bacteroidia bacterium]
MTLIEPSIFKAFSGIRCFLSTRSGGVSPEPFGLNLSFHVGDSPANVEENRRRFLEEARIPAGCLVVAGQCHSDRVACVRAPGVVDGTDGLVTDKENLWLAVSVADCVPVFLADPQRRVVAVVHAGWRGSLGRITGKAIGILSTTFGSVPEDLFVYIGPSAGPCCYEVGREVAERFDRGVVGERGGKTFLDLKLENYRQVHAAGVPASNIETSPDCTIHQSDLFHSYRRDGKRSGRMMGVIGMRQ